MGKKKVSLHMTHSFFLSSHKPRKKDAENWATPRKSVTVFSEFSHFLPTENHLHLLQATIQCFPLLWLMLSCVFQLLQKGFPKCIHSTGKTNKKSLKEHNKREKRCHYCLSIIIPNVCFNNFIWIITITSHKRT